MTARRLFLPGMLLLVLLCGCKRGPGVQSESRQDLAREGDVKRIEALVARGMDVNQKDQHGDTPLHLAAQSGHVNVVGLLLRAGADVNAQNADGDAPLHDAMRGHDETVVELLLKSGANLNVKDMWGHTPVTLAMDEDRERMARVLVRAGADVPVHLVAYVGDAERMEQMLTTGADVNALDGHGDTALHWAAKRGHKTTVLVLIEHGANLDFRWNGLGFTPLEEAVEHDHLDVAEALLAAGANPNSSDDGTSQALCCAASNGNKAMLELLLAKGARVNAKNGGGCRALHRLTAGVDSWRTRDKPLDEYIELAQLLFDHGAEISRDPDEAGYVLEFAARHGLKELAEKVLTKVGIGVANYREWRAGNPPLCDVILYGHREIVDLLIAHGADARVQDERGNTALHFAAQKGDRESAERLLAKGADVIAQNAEGATPLHEAVRAGRKEMVEFLVSRGAGLTMADAVGDTVLHCAARGQQSIIQWLLAAGAKVDAKNHKGETPLHEAAVRGHKGIVELLLAHGADPTVKDNAGETVRDKAARRGHTEIIRLLRKHARKR